MKPRPPQNRRAPHGSFPGLAKETSSASSQLVTIDKPVYGGSFLARVEGKAIFVPLTLPGEQARVRITEDKDKRGYAKAEMEELIATAPERIAPLCPHFGQCGGCNYQHADYATQLSFKKSILRETFERAAISPPAQIEVLSGEPWHYRNRIRVGFGREGDPGYRARKSHELIAIRECPIAAPLLVQAAMAAGEILARVPQNLRPHEALLFCNAEQSELLATFFVRDQAQLKLQPIAIALQERIPQLAGAELATGGRPGQPARTLARYGASSLLYRTARAPYRVDHGAFFQVNRWLIDAMVDRVVAGQGGSLAWDLFAGVGLFSVPLAGSFDRVVAVESASASAEALSANLSAAGSHAVVASTLDYLRASAGGARPDLIVVDPPRTGLDAEIATQLARIAAPALVYVSCDPATLVRDLRKLLETGYAIESVTMTDLFPQTFHLETVVRLRCS